MTGTPPGTPSQSQPPAPGLAVSGQPTPQGGGSDLPSATPRPVKRQRSATTKSPPSSPGQHVELADLVAAAARSVPGVFDLHGGAFGEVASYLPGRRVTGVRLTPERCEVHVVVIWGTPVLDTARSVQSVVAALVDTPVDVTVEDIVDPSAASSPSLTTDASTPIKETS